MACWIVAGTPQMGSIVQGTSCWFCSPVYTPVGLHLPLNLPSPVLYIIVVLALATGGRQQELLTLRWPDVDFKRGTLTFHQTKNGERRTIPLTGYALDLLKQHVRHLGTDRVF